MSTRRRKALQAKKDTHNTDRVTTTADGTTAAKTTTALSRREQLELYKQQKKETTTSTSTTAASSSSSATVPPPSLPPPQSTNQKKKKTTTAAKKPSASSSSNPKPKPKLLVPPVANEQPQRRDLTKVTTRVKRKSPEPAEKLFPATIIQEEEEEDEAQPQSSPPSQEPEKRVKLNPVPIIYDDSAVMLMCDEELPVEFVEGGGVSRQLRELLSKTTCTNEERTMICDYFQSLEDKCWALNTKLTETQSFIEQARGLLKESRAINQVYERELANVEQANTILYDRDNQYTELNILYECAQITVQSLEAQCMDQAERLDELYEQLHNNPTQVINSTAFFDQLLAAQTMANTAQQQQLQAQLDALQAEVSVRQLSSAAGNRERSALRFEVDLQTQEMAQFRRQCTEQVAAKEYELNTLREQFDQERAQWQRTKTETLDQMATAMNEQMTKAVAKLQELKTRLAEEEAKNQHLRSVLEQYDPQYQLHPPPPTEKEEDV